MSSSEAEKCPQTRESRTHITIAGNIGSGKSTVIAELQRIKGDAIYVVPENVERWVNDGLLQQMFDGFTDSRSKSSATLTFQVLGPLFDRLKLLCELKTVSADMVVTERDLLSVTHVFNRVSTDVTYNAASISPCYAALFENLCDMIDDVSCGDLLKIPALTVYLRAPADLCYKRIQKRSRECEIERISLNDLQLLEAKHDDMIEGLRQSGANVCVIVIEEDTKVEDIASIVAEKIKNF